MIKGDILATETLTPGIGAPLHDRSIVPAGLCMRVTIRLAGEFYPDLRTCNKIIIFDEMPDIDDEDRLYLAMKYPHLFGVNK